MMADRGPARIVSGGHVWCIAGAAGSAPKTVLTFIAVNIRKFVLRSARLHDLVELGSLTPSAAEFLEASVRAGLNVLVAGGTQAATDPRYWFSSGEGGIFQVK